MRKALAVSAAVIALGVLAWVVAVLPSPGKLAVGMVVSFACFGGVVYAMGAARRQPTPMPVRDSEPVSVPTVIAGRPVRELPDAQEDH